MSRPNLAAIERGRRMPHFDTIRRLALALGVYPEQVVEYWQSAAYWGGSEFVSDLMSVESTKPLRLLRAERGMTAVELGAKAGITSQTILRIERRQVIPSLDTMDWLSQALGVPPVAIREFADALEALVEAGGRAQVIPRDREITTRNPRRWKPPANHPWRSATIGASPEAGELRASVKH